MSMFQALQHYYDIKDEIERQICFYQTLDETVVYLIGGIEYNSWSLIKFDYCSTTFIPLPEGKSIKWPVLK